MTSAGQQLVAGRIPGERIATTVYDTDSSNFTTSETEIASVTASLVSGRTYRVRMVTRIGTSVANDIGTPRIREDNTSGTEMTVDYLALPNAGTAGNWYSAEAEYTAVSTGNKTFVGTCLRGGGTGNLRREAASTRPTYIYVDYIRG